MSKTPNVIEYEDPELFRQKCLETGPVFPFSYHSKGIEHTFTGLELREYVATAAMQGLLASTYHSIDPVKCARHAVACADALIEELKRGQE